MRALSRGVHGLDESTSSIGPAGKREGWRMDNGWSEEEWSKKGKEWRGNYDILHAFFLLLARIIDPVTFGKESQKFSVLEQIP